MRIRFDPNLREIAEDPVLMLEEAERLLNSFSQTRDPESGGLAGSYYRILGDLDRA